MIVDPADKFSSSSRTNLFIGAIFLFIMAIAVILVWGIGSFQFFHHVLGNGFVILTMLIGVLLTVAILFWSRYHGYFDPFELPVWISLNVYIFVLFSVLIDTNILIVTPWLKNAGEDLYSWTSILFGVGLCFMWVGYIFVIRSLSRKNTHPEENSNFRPRITFLIWAVSTLVSVLSTVTGVQGYLGSRAEFVWGNYLAALQLIGWAAWSALLFNHLSKPTKIGWVWFIFSLAIGITISVIDGTKSAGLWLVYVIMHIYYQKRKLSFRWMVLALAVIFILIPTVNGFRTILRTLAKSGDISFEQRMSAVSESLSGNLNTSPGSLVNQTYSTISGRQASIFLMSASVMSIHPSKKPFVGFEIASNLMYQVIPRIIWPGKPIGFSSVYNLNDLYYGVRIKGFSAIGIFADSYRAGSWLFVAIFFMIFGGGLAWLYWQGPAQKSRYGTVFYLTMLVWIILYEKTILGLIISSVELGLVIYVISKYVLFGPELKNYKNG